MAAHLHVNGVTPVETPIAQSVFTLMQSWYDVLPQCLYPSAPCSRSRCRCRRSWRLLGQDAST